MTIHRPDHFHCLRIILALIILTAALTGCSSTEDTGTSGSAAPAPAENGAGQLKLLILGIDGMKPEFINKYVKNGMMPNLKKIIDNGSMAIIDTKIDLKSPLIWTSIATGFMPDIHGITDFTIDGEPANSTARKVPGFWNIFEMNRVKSATLGWWATWPAEDEAGIMISDRAFWGRFENKVSPEGIIDTDRHKIVNYLREINWLHRFTAFPYDNRYKEHYKPDEWKYLINDLIYRRLISAVIRDRIYTDIAEELMEKEKPEVMAVYLQGVDYVEHAFWQFYEPEPFRKDGWPVDDQEINQLKNVIPEYHKYTDELVGRILALCGPDTMIMVMSDHGFGPDPTLRQTQPELGLSGNHRPETPFIISGPGIVKNKPQTAAVDHLDILPTILYSLELPVAQDFPGRVLKEYFKADIREALDLRLATIDTYRKFQKQRQASGDKNAEVLENLKTLGYIK